MGNVVNMFELPDSAVLTTAQKVIEVVKKRVKENPVLTFHKLSLVHGLAAPTDGRAQARTHVYCRACSNVFPGNLATVTECPHCASENKHSFEWAQSWILYDFAHGVVRAASQRRSSDEAKPAQAFDGVLVAAA